MIESAAMWACWACLRLSCSCSVGMAHLCISELVALASCLRRETSVKGLSFVVLVRSHWGVVGAAC